MDFINDCRLCRKFCTDLNDHLISSSFNGIEIHEILQQTIPIDFSEDFNLNLPQFICAECLDIINKAYGLQKIAIENDMYFRSCLELPNIKTENFENFVEVKIECEEFEEVPPQQPARKSKKRPIEHQKPVPKKQPQPEHSFNPRVAPGSEKLAYDHAFYECCFCDLVLKPKKTLLRHMRRHDPKILPHGCKKCIKRFNNEEKLEKHLKTHETDDEDIYECDLCGATGDNKNGMNNHLLDDHLKVERPKKLRINSVLKPDHGIKPIAQKCTLCKTVLYGKNELKRHFMIVHEKIIRELDPHEIKLNLKCCKCEQDHETVDELFEHISIHEIAFVAFDCKLCDLQLKNFGKFKKHSEYHAQLPNHECLKCKRFFTYDPKFLRHIQAHRNKKDVMVECPNCDMKFKGQKEFENHHRIIHEKEVLFICPICAKSYASNGSLDQHIKFVHNKDFAFKCRYCPLKFAVKCRLKRHEVTHSSERNHVCEVCSFSFKHIEGLQKHMRRHNGLLKKSHECTQCDNKYISKSLLDIHMLTHAGLKPNECKYCDRAYTLKGDLTKHMRKMHIGDAIYKCEKCPKTFRLIIELREHQADHATD